MFSRATHLTATLPFRRYPTCLASTRQPIARYQPPSILVSWMVVFQALSTSQRKRRTLRSRPWFSTLDPTRLSPDDYCDLSGKENVRPLPEYKQNKSAETTSFYLMRYFRRLPFPPGTHGFFYFHPTSTPRASDGPNDRPASYPGELRFRLTQTNDPASFAEGQDLRHADGLPWSIQFERIAVSGELRAMLLRDNLVSKELFERGSSGYSSRRVVSGLGQPFSVNLCRRSWCIKVASKYAAFDNVFLQPDGRPYFSGMSPRLAILCLPHGLLVHGPFPGLLSALNPFAAGRMLCCLERSPLPEHADLRVLVIRVLKITEPLVPLAPLPPERAMDVPVEGGLVSRKGSPHLIHVYHSRPLQWLLDAETAISASDPAPPERSDV
ncbi:hypothetical protein EVG20_g7936 [Dentipellis fragilis]|uniref:Uncharacterized protein n=1 Tax=Dentipellis fragilis TaxID=205917 RepID=A0A4Y9YBS5_9AGAM|nr:hypothetical protein EVG20_g7936 [Dentipellis fragilis]